MRYVYWVELELPGSKMEFQSRTERHYTLRRAKERAREWLERRPGYAVMIQRQKYEIDVRTMQENYIGEPEIVMEPTAEDYERVLGKRK